MHECFISLFCQSVVTPPWTLSDYPSMSDFKTSILPAHVYVTMMDGYASQLVCWRGWCGTLKRMVWYFEEDDVVLWRGWCGTLKRVLWYFEEGGVVLWRGRCGTLNREAWTCYHFERIIVLLYLIILWTVGRFFYSKNHCRFRHAQTLYYMADTFGTCCKTWSSVGRFRTSTLGS